MIVHEILLVHQQGAQARCFCFPWGFCFQVTVLLVSNWLQKISLWKKTNKTGFCLLYNSFVGKLHPSALPLSISLFYIVLYVFLYSIMPKQGSEWIFIFSWKGMNVKDKHIYITESSHKNGDFLTVLMNRTEILF